MSGRRWVAVGIVGVVALLVLSMFAGAALPSGSVQRSTVPSVGAAASHTAVAKPTLAPAKTAASTLKDRVLSALKSEGVPQKAVYLPNFEGGGSLVNGVVKPITGQAPAPMGMGDFGVRNTTGTPTPYVLSSTSWEGTLTLNSGDFFYIDNDGPDTFGVQLNAVLANVTVAGASNDVYWIQNVMFYTPSTDQIQFIDNIWNFSNPSTAEPASTFYSGNGTPTGSYYFDLGPTFTTPFPFTVHLYVNSSLTNLSSSTFSTVRFGYLVDNGAGAKIASGVYDTVLFNSMKGQGTLFTDPEFQVNGGSLTPTNFLLYDTELMIGGPGGGSTTQVYAINGSMQLAYYDQTHGRYAFDPSVWNTGTDTGETSQGLSSYYTTPGTVDLSGGPSFLLPLWNATPGGNIGALHLTGTVTPDNAFIFLSPGASFNDSAAQWAPTLPGGIYSFYVTPGTYSGEVLLSDYDSATVSYSGISGGTSTQDAPLTYDPTMGVYTPLFAWNNAQLAALSFQGNGTVGNPYILFNNQYTALPDLFGSFNDYLFPVFPGVLISGTTAYFDLYAPPPFTVTYPAAYDRMLNHNSLPDTNQLQIELYNTDHATISDGSDIGGWMCGCQFNFPNPYDPGGEVVLWGATNTLIARNTFVDQGVGIVLMQGSSNVIWGNVFENGLLGPATYPAQFGIWEMESGDLIFNNAFDTSVTAFSPSYNLYNGLTQVNDNDWDLGAWFPLTYVKVVNGFDLSGSIFGLPAVCGNWWYDYLPGSALPYNEPYEGGAPFITTGGDYCPTGPYGAVGYAVTFTETGFTSGNWSVTLAGITQSAAAGSSIVFGMPNGTWAYTLTAEKGLTVSPASGNVTVRGNSPDVAVTFSTPSHAQAVEWIGSITEYGLPAGTSWSIKMASTIYATNTSTISLLLANGTYPFTVEPVVAYTVGTSTGSVTIQGAAGAASVVFGADEGWLNYTVTPVNATVWVDGVPIPLTAGGFQLEQAPGLHSIEVAASGYASYFDNVTVAPAHSTVGTVHLTPLGSSSHGGTNGTTTSSSSNSLSSSEVWGLVGGLIVVAVAIVIAALLLRQRRGGSPPPNPPPSASATPPPSPEGGTLPPVGDGSYVYGDESGRAR
jgi:thermopsin